jgi:hypothetical protein
MVGAVAVLAFSFDLDLGKTDDVIRIRLSIGQYGRKSGKKRAERVAKVVALRRCTYAGKSYGSAEFLQNMEEKIGRNWRKPGRPKKAAAWGQSDSALFRLSEFY